eukprot:TRINITY_DN29560_c0_g1_i2.p1 TRINITY_DN29560_c0_g1~~TRINITY_DN29560_c0_g1_i2.p1  ORF type:complete len:157 (-),score=16.12 TRINITY_DN29560_c0_g1_i2:640-1086(-)
MIRRQSPSRRPTPSRERATSTTKIPFVHPAEFHGCSTTAKHWQLQDLLCCPDDRDEVFFTERENIRKYNFRTDQSEHIVTLPFAPTHFQVKHGFVVAVGNRGEICVLERSSLRVIESSKCSEHINNSCLIHKATSGRLRLFICTNDEV